ncbi:hypothetical protein DL96DRAFT_1665987 [Flagelloscypha sp. PMI_526]|nr:hypothetical protein DL96DRAFT_1665987 [Flagelloscypha sp. PMI_526]
MAPISKGSPSSKKRSSASSDIHLKKVKGENFYRNAKQVARLKMLNGGKPIRDKDGKIIQAAAFQKGEDETKPGRVQPDRRMVRLNTKKDDPYSVLLRRNKLPMALLDEAQNSNVRKRPHIVETEPFSDTFGPKSQRKRPRLDVGTFEELNKVGAAAAELAEQSASEPLASSIQEAQTHADYHEPIYAKGTSRRIYGELYKVIDSSDVILHVLDARDPMGTMCDSVLDYIKKEKSHKQVVLVINKCDLVPNWVTARYIQHLTPRYPTIAFHASPNHSFGKGSLIQLLRQFSQLHSDKKQISVGFVGYPNVGKSSVINTLKSGKTKVWQYITLTKRIYLIDCPGIVPTSNSKDTETSKVLKGVVRVEALPTPADHVPALMDRVKPLYLSRTYGKDFMDKLARMKGRLLKGGEPDLNAVAKIILSDWTRGRIPFFVPPPERPEELNKLEEAKRKKAKADAKGKDNEKQVPGVTQNLGSIMQKNTFLAEDIQPIEKIGNEVEDEENDDQGEEGEDEGEDAAGEEDELTWNDVPSESDGEAASAKGKAPRMKTNKRKAENFYSKANVKNKNRVKAKLMQSLQGKRRK